MSKLGFLVALVVSASAQAFAAESVAPLQTVTVGGRLLLADPAGMVLYTYDPDGASKSNCYGECAEDWPPLTLAAPAGGFIAPLASADRTDGTHQVTYDGHPLYYFEGDSAPKQANGDGLGHVWHVIVIK